VLKYTIDRLMQQTVNQHYLPQLLLRGFGQHDGAKKRKHRKWLVTVCKKGGGPYEDETKNVGVERYFYEKDSNGLVEKALRTREDRYARLIRKILRDKRVDRNQSALLAELFATLAARTKHTRYQFTEIGRTLFDHALEKTVRADLRKDPAFMQQAVTKTREYLAQSGISVPNHVIGSLVRDNYDEFMATAGLPTMNHLRDIVAFEGMTRDAQAKTLTAKPRDVLYRYQYMEWSIWEGAGQGFILGDGGPIALRESTNEYAPAVFVSNDDVVRVVLPVDAGHAIIGIPLGANIVPLDVNRLNLSSPKLSREFVVAASAAPLTKELIVAIGEENRCWESEIAEIISE